ncbi:MAG: hypothetical protein IKB41_02960 [Clostridia bacterium]|nr:hypothetical protein [Clostridia bacterium]
MNLMYIMALAACLLVGVLIVFLVIRLPEFKRELWYINMEIERSDEEEKLLWKKKKRKLLLSLIPFVRY